MGTDLLTRVMKHKPKEFIESRLIFDKKKYEKLINKTPNSNDVHDEDHSDQSSSAAAGNSNNLKWPTTISQEFAFDLLCSECDASKRKGTYYENVSIKLSLPRCFLNHGNGNGELNYSSFERHLIEKSE